MVTGQASIGSAEVNCCEANDDTGESHISPVRRTERHSTTRITRECWVRSDWHAGLKFARLLLERFLTYAFGPRDIAGHSVSRYHNTLTERGAGAYGIRPSFAS